MTDVHGALTEMAERAVLKALTESLMRGGTNPELEAAHAVASDPTDEKYGLLGLLSEIENDE
jgi:hypothetical protein